MRINIYPDHPKKKINMTLKFLFSMPIFVE